MKETASEKLHGKGEIVPADSCFRLVTRVLQLSDSIMPSFHGGCERGKQNILPAAPPMVAIMTMPPEPRKPAGHGKC
ncbi:hypothetical protein DBV39_16765 [Orrella marina]|uniref:Uncharacterized protein n=1 Tax=Orrella marina TaxID=2163011 RepID=A0A2R4XN25_9BURK|nr:hypothetical protein DBV39_16765 [Orrella marina]